MRGGGNFGHGSGSDAPSTLRGNARDGLSGNQSYNGVGRGSGYSNSGPQTPYSNRGGGYNNSFGPSHSHFNSRGRGGYQGAGAGPRGAPAKPTDPSAMEVLGLAPPERAAPPIRFSGPPGYLGPDNPGPIHPAHRQQVRELQREHQQQQQGSPSQQQHGGAPYQQHNRPPQQHGGQGQGGQSSRVGSLGVVESWRYGPQRTDTTLFSGPISRQARETQREEKT